ncbi:OTU domain-containing protein 3 [Discoglossus pictus]
MSRKQAVRPRQGKKAELERKRDERAVRRALAKERRNRTGDSTDSEEFVSFANQLQVLGLRLREVPGDGNCLFRALGDQIEGHSRNHLKHRQETVDYMVQHRDDFEPFVEDDVPFDRHVANLAQPGTFAGNDAIVAFARNNQVNVVIHQLNNPLWQIRGTDKANVRELHIAYRYGEHYDSVRRINDNTESPANLQTEMLSKDESNRKGKLRANLKEDRSELHLDAVQKVRNATGCADVRLILQSLEAESYNIDSAIHAILQIEEIQNFDTDTDSFHDSIDGPYTPAPWDGTECERLEIRTPEQVEICDPALSDQKAPSKQVKSDPNRNLQSQLARDTPDENNTNRAPQKISNKQMKTQQRQQKKKRQEERHRQKVLENMSNNTDNNKAEADADPEGVTVVKALAALNI